MSNDVLTLKYCRLCKSKNLKLVLDLGKSPLPNAFLKKWGFREPERIFPLRVNFCLDCGQVQLSHVVSPDLMFRDYAYVSSTSPVMVKHFQDYAQSIVKKLRLKNGDFVVEMGSNDGALLRDFQNFGMKILGVDPARNVAKRASSEGIPTLPEFFNSKIAKNIANKYGKAMAIAGNNVFAHIHDLDEVVKGVNVLLDINGAFIVEFPYLTDTLDNNVFDQVYHEHLSYLSLSPLDKFFKSFGMQIFDVVRTPVQGGSIRVLTKKLEGKYKRSQSVLDLLDLEKKKKLHKVETYLEFAQKVQKTKSSLNSLLKNLKKDNKKIVGYGAPGRSTTLLNYFGINNQILDFIVDDNPYKHDLITPGTHIPVIDIPHIEKINPDYILILSWNYAQPIMKKLSDYKKSGGKFIIPVPVPTIV